MSATTRSAKIRAQLNHPVIDADGHWLEPVPVFLDFLQQEGGGGAVDPPSSSPGGDGDGRRRGGGGGSGLCDDDGR